ncbi:hypothetical protein GH714_033327 [Hevea brasiliensis]|uniref:Uncharacterized protein n=1 Tax=Hevea brasiliensis TaxID=3981 RepID=A0A6A6KMF3_HEVBR|nr:hypothetical protein GH714_033327 [Hevea brasiliensis]
MQLGWVIMSAEDGGRGEQEYAHNPSAAQRNPAGCRPTVSNDEFDQENGGYAQVVGTRESVRMKWTSQMDVAMDIPDGCGKENRTGAEASINRDVLNQKRGRRNHGFK